MKKILLILIVPFFVFADVETAENEYLQTSQKYTGEYLDYLKDSSNLSYLQEVHAQLKGELTTLQKEQRTTLPNEIAQLERQLRNIESIIKNAAKKVRTKAITLMKQVKSGNRFLQEYAGVQYPQIWQDLDNLTTDIRTDRRLSYQAINEKLAPTLAKLENQLISGLSDLQGRYQQQADEFAVQVRDVQSQMDAIEGRSEFRNLNSRVNNTYSTWQSHESNYQYALGQLRDAESSLHQVTSDLLSAEHTLREGPTDLERAKDDFRRGRTDLERYEGDAREYQQRIERNERNLEQARSNGNQERVNRIERRLREVLIPGRDEAQRKVGEVRETLRELQDRIDTLEVEIREASSNVDRLRRQQSSWQSEVDSHSSEVRRHRHSADAANSEYQNWSRQFESYKEQTGYNRLSGERSQLSYDQSRYQDAVYTTQSHVRYLNEKAQNTLAQLNDVKEKEAQRASLPQQIAEKKTRLNETLPREIADMQGQVSAAKEAYNSARGGLLEKKSQAAATEGEIFRSGGVLDTLYASLSPENQPQVNEIETRTSNWSFQTFDSHDVFGKPACVAVGNDLAADKTAKVLSIEILGIKDGAMNANPKNGYSEAFVALTTFAADAAGGNQGLLENEVVPKAYHVEMRIDNGNRYTLGAIQSGEQASIGQIFMPKINEREKLIKDMKRRNWAKIQFFHGETLVFEVPKFRFRGVTRALDHMDNDRPNGPEICKLKYQKLGTFPQIR